ncbi:hypothetical protein pb186bvf_014669 [Paramecium bursaria]
MAVLSWTFYWTFLIYGLLFHFEIIKIYISLLVIYLLFGFLYYPGNFGSIRRRVSLSLWDPPKEGMICNKMELDATNALKYLQSQQARDNKITITHICIRALAECLAQSRYVANGKIVFGKYIPHDTVDISCLVNVQEGTDLTAVLVKNADKMTFKQIAEFINQNAQKAKQGKDDVYLKKLSLVKNIPSLLILIILELEAFISYNLGISIPFLSIEKNCCGGATLTSLGGFGKGYTDVQAPFSPFIRSSLIMAVNKIEEKPVVRNGQIGIAPILIVKFTVDHRYVDGGSALKGTQSFIDVVENPEKYL